MIISDAEKEVLTFIAQAQAKSGESTSKWMHDTFAALVKTEHERDDAIALIWEVKEYMVQTGFLSATPIYARVDRFLRHRSEDEAE